MKLLKKLFGGIRLSWPRLLLAAVLAGGLTGVIALIPGLHDTSLHTVTVTFELWIFFGIWIIMNSKSNLDAALKCFVFFRVSQPLVYLIQVPFSSMGWGLFGYYKYWFIWTLLCLPMGFVGYYMKKGKWWGYLILLPMLALTGLSYHRYFSDFLFYMPRFLLVCLFCACMMILYPLAIFEDKRIRTVGACLGLAAVAVLTVIGLLHPPVYRTELMGNDAEHPFDDTCRVSLADESYGTVEIVYLEQVQDYMVRAELKKAGKTVLTLEGPDGEKTEYDLSIRRDSFEITPR